MLTLPLMDNGHLKAAKDRVLRCLHACDEGWQDGVGRNFRDECLAELHAHSVGFLHESLRLEADLKALVTRSPFPPEI